MTLVIASDVMLLIMEHLRKCTIFSHKRTADVAFFNIRPMIYNLRLNGQLVSIFLGKTLYSYGDIIEIQIIYLYLNIMV